MDEYNMDDTLAGLDEPMDTIFGTEEDGDLIDYAAGLREDGSSELDADFDEMHNEEGEEGAEPEDLEDGLGPDNDTPNAPEIQNPIDTAIGESGAEGASDFSLDKDQVDDDGTGKKRNMDDRDLDKESLDAIDAAFGEGADCDNCDEGDDVPDDTDDPVDESAMSDADDQLTGDDLEHEPGDEELIDMVIGGQA